MRKVVAVGICCILLFNMVGCRKFGGMEIDEILFASAFAIDLPKGDSGNVRVTVSSMKVQSSSGKGGGTSGKTSDTLSSEGRTILEAVRKLNTLSDRRIFYGQVKYLLVGEDAAKKDILKYLDIFERNYEIRLNALVVIVKDGTAEEVLEKAKTSESFIADRLKSIFNNRGKLSISDQKDQTEVMEMFDNTYMSAYIPYIHLVKGIEREKEEDKEKFDIQLDGFAVFKETSLLGYLTGNDGRGLNWIRGKVESGAIVVKNFSGEDVSLDIIESNVKIVPKFDGDMPSIWIRIQMTSNVDEVWSRNDVIDEKHFDYFEKQQEKIIKAEGERVIAYAQENNADFIEICNAINHKAPLKWNKIKEQWSSLFPKLKINVEVTSNINRTYDIKEPTRSKEREKQ